MQQGTLIFLYLAVGFVFGGLHYHQSTDHGMRQVASALTLVVVWPLWAPFAMSPAPPAARGPIASRISLALERVGSPVKGREATVLDRGEISALMKQVDAAEERLRELDAQLSAMHQEPSSFPREGPDAEARARIRASSITQLEVLRDREHTALLELADTCDLLRAQHLVSRFGGAGHDDLRDELWARVQALTVLAAERY
jgi:hypothetical protein